MIASNQAFVIAAYAITWIVLLGYLTRLARKESSARAGLARSTGQGGEVRP